MIRVAALVAAVLCAGAAVYVSGALAAGPPEGPVQQHAPADTADISELVERVDVPAQVEPVADAGELLVAAEPFVPVRLEVPAAGVRAPVDPLGLDPEGALEVPEDGSRAGWWSGGMLAGDPGPAVVAGHVDFRGGQAGIFHALELLGPGDRARVISDDGRYLDYEITEVETVAKEAFPTASVYAPTGGAELRLITCGGPFNPLSRAYRDNVIAYAVLVAPST